MPCSPLLSKASLPHTPSRRDASRLLLMGCGWGGAGSTFWVPNQQHQPVLGGVEAAPVVGYDLHGEGKRPEGRG